MRAIKEIKEQLEHCPAAELPALLRALEGDERKGVQRLLEAARKRQAAAEKEAARLEGLLRYERECYARGCTLVAGVDEVGRGSLAGPVVAAAVILPPDCRIAGIDDSKKLSAKKREMLYDVIREEAVSVGIGVVPNARIDEINILQATYEAMRQALAQLSPQPQQILADAVTIPQVAIPQTAIIKGDAKSLSIGAASIIAKVYRDRMMLEYDALYPDYGFAANKGYGSAAHIEAIRRLGLTPLHRRSFVKRFVPQEGESAAEKGGRGEALAAQEMRRMGYEILAQNYRGAQGEIDIIARKGETLVFTEVKYRSSAHMAPPAAAVDLRKQRHIVQAAEAYLAEQGLDAACRFDVAEVLTQNGRTYFRYLEDAFRPE